jgi:hypothetical protein
MMVRIEKSSMDIKIDCFLKTSSAFTPDYRLQYSRLQTSFLSGQKRTKAVISVKSGQNGQGGLVVLSIKAILQTKSISI